MPKPALFLKTRTGLRFVLRAMRHRNFRLFVVGQSVSLIGTWMQQVAMSWLVYRLTGSAFMLGLVAFAGQIPTLLLSPIAGVFADHSDRLKILLVTESLAMFQAVLLTVLVFMHWIDVPWIIVLSLFLGLVNAFDVPARQSFFIDMIEKREDLGNAIALNSSMFNGARLIGPSVAGILIAVGGEALCFFVNAVSFIGVLWALLAMNIRPREKVHHGKPLLGGMYEGFSYAFGFAPILYILLLLGGASLLGLQYTLLMPVFAKDILGGGPGTLGILVAAAGLGALAGALYMASRKNVLGLTRKIALSSFGFGASLVAFSFSRDMLLSSLLMVATGFGMMVHLASSNTVLQTVVDDDKRGRVMSLYTVALIGMSPFGSLLSGILAARIGAPLTLGIGGAACMAGAAWFASRLPVIRQTIRPVYLKKGILPNLQPEN